MNFRSKSVSPFSFHEVEFTERGPEWSIVGVYEPVNKEGDMPDVETVPLTFYGASDDLVEIDGVLGADEFNVDPSGPWGYAGTWNVGGALRVHAFYGRGGWFFGVAQASDEQRLPNWKIEVSQSAEVEYSTKLTIHVPVGTSIFKEDYRVRE